MGNNSNNRADKKQVDDLFNQLSSYQSRGYFLNYNEAFAKAIITGLLFNETRYGYQSCPCRLASGDKLKDLDIICPCYYRDADLAEYGACLCGLYISRKAYMNKEPIKPAPERRPVKELNNKITHMENGKKQLTGLSYPVWRCDVCGYLCARGEAPDICPICGAAKDRFQRFI